MKRATETTIFAMDNGESINKYKNSAESINHHYKPTRQHIEVKTKNIYSCYGPRTEHRDCVKEIFFLLKVQEGTREQK